VIDVVGGWYEAAIEQQVLGACVESFHGHVISLSPHGGSHLSSNLRAFIARLIVPFSSSGLGVRAIKLSSPSCGRGVVARTSCRSYLCRREGGPHTLPTPETS
jgi:hypothetical protein